MLATIVVTRYRTGNLLVTRVVMVVDIMHGVAVVVVLHIRVHVRLIMTEVIRSMMAVVMREVIPVVRRTPMAVVRTSPAVEHRRTFVEHRFDDIVHTVDIRRTDNLNVRRRVPHLHNERCHILVDVGSQHGLDKQHMVMAVNGLKHTQVVDVPVVVEVEVRDDI